MVKQTLTFLLGLGFLTHVWAESSAQPKVGTFQPIDCPKEILPETGAENISCGYLIVPETHLSPTDKTLKLFVAVAKSTAAQANPDPLAILSGGPGLPASRFVRPSAVEPARILKRDIIFMDQRGTGRSIPRLSCPTALSGGSTQDCVQKFIDEGIDLSKYNTVENALDFKMLRETLDINQWNLDGASYGSRLALEIMRVDPKGVRSSVLSSVAPPNRTLISVDVLANAERVFELMFSDCAKEPRCYAAYPNLKQEFLALEGYLDKSPRTFRYVKHLGGKIFEEKGGFSTLLKVIKRDIASVRSRLLTDYKSPRTLGEVHKIQQNLNMGRVETLPDYIHELYLHHSTGKVFPEEYQRRVFGDSEADSNQDSDSSQEVDLEAMGMNISVTCREDIPFGNVKILEKIIPQFAPYDLAQKAQFITAQERCLAWTSGIADSSFHDPVVSSIPTLIFSGAYDIATPPDWAKAAAEFLSNSTSVYLPNAGHDPVFSSQCSLNIFNAFLMDPIKKPDTQCVDQLKPPTFVVPEAS